MRRKRFCRMPVPVLKVDSVCPRACHTIWFERGGVSGVEPAVPAFPRPNAAAPPRCRYYAAEVLVNSIPPETVLLHQKKRVAFVVGTAFRGLPKASNESATRHRNRDRAACTAVY